MTYKLVEKDLCYQIICKSDAVLHLPKTFLILNKLAGRLHSPREEKYEAACLDAKYTAGFVNPRGCWLILELSPFTSWVCSLILEWIWRRTFLLVISLFFLFYFFISFVFYFLQEMWFHEFFQDYLSIENQVYYKVS